ncbi:hypothetical protein BTS2_2976 [Bacillus sp. TS-2]|nr:hypothetical protein BTS2_2976 [Bacillus sp. TS-2]
MPKSTFKKKLVRRHPTGREVSWESDHGGTERMCVESFICENCLSLIL